MNSKSSAFLLASPGDGAKRGDTPSANLIFQAKGEGDLGRRKSPPNKATPTVRSVSSVSACRA